MICMKHKLQEDSCIVSKSLVVKFKPHLKVIIAFCFCCARVEGFKVDNPFVCNQRAPSEKRDHSFSVCCNHINKGGHDLCKGLTCSIGDRLDNTTKYCILFDIPLLCLYSRRDSTLEAILERLKLCQLLIVNISCLCYACALLFFFKLAPK